MMKPLLAILVSAVLVLLPVSAHARTAPPKPAKKVAVVVVAPNPPQVLSQFKLPKCPPVDRKDQ